MVSSLQKVFMWGELGSVPVGHTVENKVICGAVITRPYPAGANPGVKERLCRWEDAFLSFTLCRVELETAADYLFSPENTHRLCCLGSSFLPDFMLSSDTNRVYFYLLQF